VRKGYATILGVASEYTISELIDLKTIFEGGTIKKMFANWATMTAKQAMDISLKDNQKRDQLIGLHSGLAKIEKNISEDLDTAIAVFKEQDSND